MPSEDPRRPASPREDRVHALSQQRLRDLLQASEAETKPHPSELMVSVQGSGHTLEVCAGMQKIADVRASWP